MCGGGGRQIAGNIAFYHLHRIFKRLSVFIDRIHGSDEGAPYPIALRIIFVGQNDDVIAIGITRMPLCVRPFYRIRIKLFRILSQIERSSRAQQAPG